MPTYDFRCLTCGGLTEAVMAMDSNTVPFCVACGGITKKVFSPVAISFKGSGFYSTDKRTRKSVSAKVTN